MDKEQKELFTKEVNNLIQSRCEFIDRFYPVIREPYKHVYDWPELDPLRHEICICIIFGLCLAAITLTNHLLESLLKYALIIHHGKDKRQQNQIKGITVTSFMEPYKDEINRYGNAKLANNINNACTHGLISKDQKKQLHKFRIKYRDAYSHSDKEKTFGKSTTPITIVNIENSKFELGDTIETEIAQFILGQGLIQAEKAQDDAPIYFLYIDKLVREIWVKLFDPTDKDSHIK